MSFKLFNATHAPATNGLKHNPNSVDPTKEYVAIAYYFKHAKSTYFAAQAGTVTQDEKTGKWSHVGLISAVNNKVLPAKDDDMCWGISAEEYMRLVDCEKKWWDVVEEYQKRPGVSFAQACNFAHAEVVKNQVV